jgi:hypothetical protein
VAQPTLKVQLRASRAGFANEVAACLDEPGVRILSEREAVTPMRRILSRYGLENAQAIRQGDGRMTPTWYEAPELWIKRWSNSESAIVLQENSAGPLSLRFVMRLASDTYQTTFFLGMTPAPSLALLRAAWDVGLRTAVAETDHARPEPGAERLRGYGLTLKEETVGATVVRTMTMTRRP